MIDYKELYKTTMARYAALAKTCDQLTDDIGNRGAIVKRKFSTGRECFDVNPSIELRNKTAKEANATVTTLVALIPKLEAAGLWNGEEDTL